MGKRHGIPRPLRPETQVPPQRFLEMKPFAVFALLLLSCQQAWAFVARPALTKKSALPNPRRMPFSQPQPFTTPAPVGSSSTQLFAESYDGFGRGLYILGASLLLCVWFFSIPPAFRRTHFCATPACVEYREACYDCRTFDEWRSDIVDYYKNGGGVNFDFTIDPASKEEFKKTIEGFGL